MNTGSKLTHRLRWTMVILFFFILWVPIIQMIHPILPEMESTENRKLAEKPKIKFSLIALVNYTRQLNMYINDHFGLRNFMIRVNCMIHVKLLHTSPTRDVVWGREGWLYHDRYDDGVSLMDFFGYARFRESELEMILEKITKINRFCEERGILLKIVVVPNKHTIYPEFLPLDIKNRQGDSTRLDQLKDYLIRNKLGSVLIDLRPTLVSSKGMQPYPLYYLTDSHWNQMGGFIAYTEIMKDLLPRFPHIKILNITNYSVSQWPTYHLHRLLGGAGDLANSIGMSGLMKDTEIVLEPQAPYLAKFIDPGIEVEGTYDIRRYHIEKSNYPKLVMFRDSFGYPLYMYLSESFSDSLYVWYIPFGVNLSVIEKERPQVVILQLVERNLQELLKPIPPRFKKRRGQS